MKSDFVADKIVYFVRHGESSGNISDTFQGTESVLTEQGKRQAVLIADRVANIEFETLLSSPLPRATQTAEAIAAATGKSIEYSDLLVERVKPISLIGKSKSDEGVPGLSELYERSLYTPGLRAEDAENYDDLLVRADKVLEFLQERAEKSLVVVSHGYFLRFILARILLGDTLTGESFKIFQARIASQNTGITVIKYGKTWEGDAWRLWIYNDHAHLG